MIDIQKAIVSEIVFCNNTYWFSSHSPKFMPRATSWYSDHRRRWKRSRSLTLGRQFGLEMDNFAFDLAMRQSDDSQPPIIASVELVERRPLPLSTSSGRLLRSIRRSNPTIFRYRAGEKLLTVVVLLAVIVSLLCLTLVTELAGWRLLGLISKFTRRPVRAVATEVPGITFVSSSIFGYHRSHSPCSTISVRAL